MTHHIHSSGSGGVISDLNLGTLEEELDGSKNDDYRRHIIQAEQLTREEEAAIDEDGFAQIVKKKQSQSTDYISYTTQNHFLDREHPNKLARSTGIKKKNLDIFTL